MDTIFALASARGKAGVAVIRVSGPRAALAAREIAGLVPDDRRATLARLRNADGTLLDEAVVLVFPEGASFTGESVVEFQVHGSPATVRALLGRLAELEGLRLAEPGEFTRRALENGRLDLAQVEGLADLIEAETEAQRKQALRVFTGAVGDKAESWRRHLVRAAALLEATIDFADEEVPEDVSGEVVDLLGVVLSDLEREAAGVGIAERIREGFEVAIVGPPNAGKSTLLNALAGRDAAITSEIAGTTRDVIEVRMDLAGLPVTVLDTAGIRETSDIVEGLGVERARQRAEAADLRVFLLAEPDEAPAFAPKPGDIVAYGKADVQSGAGRGVSGKTGQGLELLVSDIGAVLSERTSAATSMTRARHRDAILRAGEALRAAIGLSSAGPELTDIAAEEVRTAIRALDSLVGRIDVEHILDEIFASFCLGK